VPELTGRRWTRRAVLALGAGTAGLLLPRTPARAVAVSVGGLAFEVPAEIRPVEGVGGGLLGEGWQWRGHGVAPAGDQRAAPVVLARADLASTDPQEVVGHLLAGATTGLLPGLELRGRRARAMPGGGDQTRLDLAYAAAEGLRLHGTLLVATQAEPPAAVLVVLGDDSLTAGTVGWVLDSARWVR
jgi:hypothetical protein